MESAGRPYLSEITVTTKSTKENTKAHKNKNDFVFLFVFFVNYRG